VDEQNSWRLFEQLEGESLWTTVLFALAGQFRVRAASVGRVEVTRSFYEGLLFEAKQNQEEG